MEKKLKKLHAVAEVAKPLEREYIDVPGAADFACCSKATIRRMLTAGELTRFKFGARTLIKVAELRGLVRVDTTAA
jgi:hypothetical protein